MESEFAGTERFVVEASIGEGGMGAVYRAYDRELERHVALKVLLRLGADALLRFKQEFRALQDLSHPNLVSLGELVESEGQWFFSMELVEGTDFFGHVRGTSQLDDDAIANTLQLRKQSLDGPHTYSESKLRSALRQLAQGLFALHVYGKVHRDIKPSNIIVTPAGRVVLLDFGLITDVERERQSKTSHVVGTAAYMAPEQAASGDIGPAADWYSMGVLLYECLTGRLPFSGPMLEVLMNKQRYEPPPPSIGSVDIPGDLDALCVDLLRTDPAARPTGARILARLGVSVDAEDAARADSMSASESASRVPFVGRNRELAVLQRACARADMGNQVVAVIDGASGVGKSALARRFIGDVEKRKPGIVVLEGRCFEREEVPFNAFDGVIDALSRYLRQLDQVQVAWKLPRRISLLARLFPVLRYVPAVEKVASDLRGAPTPEEIRSQAFEVLRDFFARLASENGLLIYIDDMQWADADSVALLSDLLEIGASECGWMLIATYRPVEGSSLIADYLQRAERNSDIVERVQLRPLPLRDARALAAHFVGGDASSDAVARIAVESAGHPFFIQELAQHVESGVVTAALDDVLWSRISKLEVGVLDLLAVVSVAGAGVRVDIANDAAGLSSKQGERAIGVLRVANLVRTTRSARKRRLQTYHDRIRETVLANLTADALRGWHRRLAAAYEADGAAIDDPRLLVRHLVQSGQEERAVGYAERAAESAASALAFDHAAQFYGVALRRAPDAERARSLRIRCGDALVSAGRGVEAAQMFLRAAENASASVAAECRRKAAEQLLFSGHVDRGTEVLRELLTEAGEPFAETPRAILASLLWQRFKLRLRGLRWKRREASEIAPTSLQRMDVYKATGVGYSMVDTVRAAEAGTRGLLLALRCGEPVRLGRFLANEAGYHATRGMPHHGRATKVLIEAERIAEDEDSDYLRGWCIGVRGVKHYFAGEFEPACQAFRSSEQTLLTLPGTSWELGTMRNLRLIALRHRGCFDELEDSFTRLVRDAGRRRDLHADTTMRRGANIVWLVKDDVDEARWDLDSARWSPPSDSDYHLQHWYELRAHAEIALYEGEIGAFASELGEGLARLKAALISRVQSVKSEALWIEGRAALAADGDAAKRSQTALRCAAKLDREGVCYARAWGGLLRGGALAIRGKHEDAADVFGAVVEMGGSIGFYTEAARWLRGALHGGQTGKADIRAVRAMWMRRGVREPARLLEVVAPCLGDE